MPKNPKIYIETTCFVEMAKHAIGSGNAERDADVWHFKLTERLEELAVHVRYPRETQCLPGEYRQGLLAITQEAAPATTPDPIAQIVSVNDPNNANESSWIVTSPSAAIKDLEHASIETNTSQEQLAVRPGNRTPQYRKPQITKQVEAIMKSQPKPIQIPPELAARCEGNDQAERMDKAFLAVLSTPHSAVMKDTAKRKQARRKSLKDVR